MHAKIGKCSPKGFIAFWNLTTIIADLTNQNKTGLIKSQLNTTYCTVNKMLYLKTKREKAVYCLSYNCVDIWCTLSFSVLFFVRCHSEKAHSWLEWKQVSDFSHRLSGRETPQSHLLCLWDVGRVSGHRNLRWDLCGGTDGSGSKERWWVDCQIYSKEAGGLWEACRQYII